MIHRIASRQATPVYSIVARDHQAIHFRCAEPPVANPDRYADEMLDAYLFVEEFTRTLADTQWYSREFVVKDCDGRLLAFGADCNE